MKTYRPHCAWTWGIGATQSPSGALRFLYQPRLQSGVDGLSAACVRAKPRYCGLAAGAAAGQNAGTLRYEDEREEEGIGRTNGAPASLQRLERLLRKFIDERMT